MIQIVYEGIQYGINEEFSRKDFTGQSQSQKKIPEGTVIYGSCFSQEIPNSEVFPRDMVGVTFIKCNLDNCAIPHGNFVIDCSRRKFCCQNDLRDWELDNEDKPVKVINEKYWIQKGISIDAKDIPAEKLASIKELKKVGV